MVINYVKTHGFRKFEEKFETDLYDITKVSGKNRSGKSNLLYIIINSFLGTNLSGNEKVCLINNKCDDSYNEIHFTDNNGEKHVLIRKKNKYSYSENYIILDGKVVKQEDLVSFYKDKKLLLSVMNPIYFLNKKSAEQKELVDKYLSDIKPKEIFDRLDEETKNILLKKHYNNTEKSFNELSQKEQTDFINLKMYNICMEIAYNNLSKDEQKVLSEIPINIPTYITELNSDIKQAENKISTLNGKIDYAENIVNEEIPKRKKFEKDEELSIAKDEIKFLNNNENIINKENLKKSIEKLESEILQKETEFNSVEQQMKKGKQDYLNIKNGVSCKCPTCNQNIADVSKKITINNMYSELVKMFDRKNLLESQIVDLKSKCAIERCKYHALEGETIIDKQKRIEVVEENIKALEKEKQEIQIYNNQIDIKEQNIDKAKKDIEQFNIDKKKQEEFINCINDMKKIAQKLYIGYIEEKMKLVKDYLKDVDIKFYSVNKGSGEIKDDFIITYKGNQLSDLSRSETIATALEFSNMFNKISGINFPIFIDDYESCVDYDFISEYAKDTQIIVAKVEKGQKIKVENYCNENHEVLKVA